MRVAHYLSNINELERTADCKICGLNIRIRKKGHHYANGKTRWKCVINDNEYEKRYAKTERGKIRRQLRNKRKRNTKLKPKLDKIRKNLPKLWKDIFGPSSLFIEHSKKEYCECCGVSKKLVDTLNIDHCHKTGLYRGALCQKCNFGLGFFQDSPEILFLAIKYLNRFHKFLHEKVPSADATLGTFAVMGEVLVDYQI